MAGLGPLEAVIRTFGEGVADLAPHEAVIDTFGEGVADLDPHETIIGTFGGGVFDLDPHGPAIYTFDMGVAVLDPQEVLIVESAVTGVTKDDEAETFEGKLQSCNSAKLTDAVSTFRRSARNENALSKELLPGWEDILKHHIQTVPMELMPLTGHVCHHTKHHSENLLVFGCLHHRF